jgi:hypothetical protein
MAERDPAAVGVHVPPALLEAAVAHELERHGRERLVHLHHGDVVPRKPGAEERTRARLGIAVQHQPRVDADEPEGGVPCPGLEA